MLGQNKEKAPILDVQNLKKFFPVKGSLGGLGKTQHHVKAVNDVSIKLYEGETYGLVGESGCGKSTTGRSILRLTEPTDGSVIYKGRDILKAKGKELQNFRKDVQMVFQDPYSSLNPRKRIGTILEEPLKIQNIGTKSDRTDRVMEMMEKVGMRMDHYYRYPHEFSGGQRQRFGLARALVINPHIVICDEPVSALDVSIQSQIINLLQALQKDMNLTYLFIAHDISVVRHISDRVGVMYLGKIAEEAPTDNLFQKQYHPYTEALFSAVPHPDPKKKEKRERIILEGDIPSPLNPPTGCFFSTRCPHAMDICKQVEPQMQEMEDDHYVACHLYNS